MSNVVISKNEKERIAIVTLSKEPFNICDMKFYGEIASAFKEINLMDDISVVILRSACKHFCTGGDLSEIQLCNTEDNVSIISGAAVDCMEAIYSCRYPVIAAVHGKSIGAGVAMVASCDVCIATEDAIFSLPEIKAGYIGASAFLEMLIPRRLARYYMFTGEPITSSMLKNWGSILDVVVSEQLDKKAMEIAKKIAEQSPLALTYFKKAMNHNDNERLREKFIHESQYTVKYSQSMDCKETFLAFKEKRKPKYSGK